MLQELASMKTLDVAAFKEKLFKLQPRGGTDMELGINGGAKLFEGLPNEAGTGKQNRMMFLTDAQVGPFFAPPVCAACAHQRCLSRRGLCAAQLGVDFAR